MQHQGYVVLSMPGHVLAAFHGQVLRHRLVLFDKIGLGPHRCHWCAEHVNWTPQQRGHPEGSLVVDHLDFTPGSDHADNLVPSCNVCNSKRQKRKGTKLDPEKVRAIRRAYTGKPGADYASIGREFGITETHARNVVLGLAWLDVSEDEPLSVP